MPSLHAGTSASFNGHPVTVQDDVPTIPASGTAAKVAIFDDPRSGYALVERSGMTVQRSVELCAEAGGRGGLQGAPPRRRRRHSRQVVRVPERPRLVGGSKLPPGVPLLSLGRASALSSTSREGTPHSCGIDRQPAGTGIGVATESRAITPTRREPPEARRHRPSAPRSRLGRSARRLRRAGRARTSGCVEVRTPPYAVVEDATRSCRSTTPFVAQPRTWMGGAGFEPA
jgi:hypothetical protein